MTRIDKSVKDLFTTVCTVVQLSNAYTYRTSKEAFGGKQG